MISLVKEHQFKPLAKLPFCYLCGKRFSTGETTTRDHVPPKNIFHAVDRKAPLILPAHASCNLDQSDYDEEIGQLIRILHTKPTDKNHLHKLQLEFFRETNSTTPIVGIQIDFTKIVFRWLRGFHAALYKEPLSDHGGFVHSPLAQGNPKTGFRPIPEIHLRYVDEIKKNRQINNFDTIQCWNGKCRYECVWSRTDGGEKVLCIFALNVYDWHELGDTTRTPARSCVGIYTPPLIPAGAAVATKIDFPYVNRNPLDAFQP